MSTTQAELDGALRRLARSARTAGLDPTDWALHGGSASNGVSFRLATGSTLMHLGKTKTDAWRTLSAMAEAFELLENARNRGELS